LLHMKLYATLKKLSCLSLKWDFFKNKEHYFTVCTTFIPLSHFNTLARDHILLNLLQNYLVH
jgi:hypothetical protein